MLKRAAPNKRKLNELFVKKLRPQPRAFMVWDSAQWGLALRMEPTGHAAWKVVYPFGGRPRWFHIGSAAAIGLADARKLASRIMYQVAEGKDPCAERKAERGKGTFEELALRYVEQYAKRKNRSWKQADALVRRHLLPKWAKLQATDIARSDVKAMMARIDAPITANQVLAAASAIFSWAIREEVAGIKLNPCQGVERNGTQSRERILSVGEIPKFWTGFGEADYVRGLALKMILLTGQRPGEVRHMRSEHVEDGWWSLPGAVIPDLGWPGTKNGASHRVWLPAPAQKILIELNATGFVFAGTRGNAIDKLEEVMREISSDLGVEKATPHDLRRTHGTTITALGFGRDAMNRVQNHKEGGIASVYDRHQYAEENKRIMEAVAQKIMSFIDGEPDNVVAFSGQNQTRLKVPR
jgi:integrase